MPAFNTWRPNKLVEHGENQISKATDLLVSYKAKLDESKQVHAQSLVDYAKDIRQALNDKCLLARIKPARLFAKSASEALHAIEGRTSSLGRIL